MKKRTIYIKSIQLSTVAKYASVLGCVAVVLSSCSNDPLSPGLEFMPDMYRSPSVETYLQNPNNPDSSGMSAMKPVKGTIPRGFMPWEYGSSNEEYVRSKGAVNPIAYSDDVLSEGEAIYTKMCQHCHGAEGAGDGGVVEVGNFPPPPAYKGGMSSRGGTMAELTPGQIFHTITYGINMMGSHASQISPEDRWKLIYYIQKLQGVEPGAVTAAIEENGDDTVSSEASENTVATPEAE